MKTPCCQAGVETAKTISPACQSAAGRASRLFWGWICGRTSRTDLPRTAPASPSPWDGCKQHLQQWSWEAALGSKLHAITSSSYQWTFGTPRRPALAMAVTRVNRNGMKMTKSPRDPLPCQVWKWNILKMSLQWGLLREARASFDRNSSVAHGAGMHGAVGAGADLFAQLVCHLGPKLKASTTQYDSVQLSTTQQARHEDSANPLEAVRLSTTWLSTTFFPSRSPGDGNHFRQRTTSEVTKSDICWSTHTAAMPTSRNFWGFVEGSLEVKLPTIWRDEKQSRAEAERRGRLEERRSEEKE